MCNILPNLVQHLFTVSQYLFIFFTKSLEFFLLLCTRDFSRVHFATELSTNLIYNSIFVIDYIYIYIYFHLFVFSL